MQCIGGGIVSGLSGRGSDLVLMGDCVCCVFIE